MVTIYKFSLSLTSKIKFVKFMTKFPLQFVYNIHNTELTLTGMEIKSLYLKPFSFKQSLVKTILERGKADHFQV